MPANYKIEVPFFLLVITWRCLLLQLEDLSTQDLATQPCLWFFSSTVSSFPKLCKRYQGSQQICQESTYIHCYT